MASSAASARAIAGRWFRYLTEQRVCTRPDPDVRTPEAPPLATTGVEAEQTVVGVATPDRSPRCRRSGNGDAHRRGKGPASACHDDEQAESTHATCSWEP
jgi:hypothetical protein